MRVTTTLDTTTTFPMQTSGEAMLGAGVGVKTTGTCGHSWRLLLSETCTKIVLIHLNDYFINPLMHTLMLVFT